MTHHWRRRFRAWCSRIAHWPRRRARDAGLAEEIAAHLQLEAAALEAEGLSPADARAAARRAFGDPALALEDSRAAWRWGSADDLARDLRLAFRSLAHNRGFAAAATITLALGVAALATMFSLVDAALLRPVPIAQPQRVAVLSEYYARNGGYLFGGVSPLDYLALRRRVPSFSAQTAAAGAFRADLGSGGGLTPVRVQAVEPNFFSVLGVSAQLGRTFSQPAAQPSAAPAAGAPAVGPAARRAAVISAGLWRSQFAATRSILGRQIRLNQEPYTVIGVMPPQFPTVPRAYAQIWIPLAFGPAQLARLARGDRSLTVFARLRPGATFRRAQAQLTAAMARLARRYRADHEWRVVGHPLNTFNRDKQNNGPTFTLLMAGAGLLLLLACANVAGLLLARAAARRHELALRAALGASRFRLFRQLLAESALLAAGAAALGLAVSSWTIRLLASRLQPLAPGMPALRLDWPVALFALAVAAFTVLLFGVAPAWQASRADPQSALQENARGSVGGRARLRRCLVAGEVALTIVLLAAAAITFGSVVMQLSPAGFGFNPRRLTVASVSLHPPGPGGAASAPRDPATWATNANAIAARLRHLPGVTAAATAGSLPLTGSGATGVIPRSGGASDGAAFYPVSPDYFATLQMPLLRGRDFTAADTAAAPAVAIVDRRFVRQYLHGRSPLGRAVVVDYFYYLNARGKLVDASVHPRPVTIVGVAGPVQRFLGYIQREPAMYFPLAQWPTAHLYAIVRSAGQPPTAAEMDRAIRAVVGPRAVIGGVGSVDKLIAGGAEEDWVVAGLVAVFAGLALILAAVGIYGVMAYAARRRTAEIGVRLALGARRRAIAAMFLREAAIFTGIGWIVGLGLAVLLPRTMAALFGPGYLPTYAQSVWPGAALIPLAAFAAAYLPARRAARLDPAHCLRHE